MLCNTAALAVNGPLLEEILGYRNFVLFVCLASVASSLVSLKLHGQPSIGSSGVVYAIDGFLLVQPDIELEAFDLIFQVLFSLAKEDDMIDHAAHAGGFFFGYIVQQWY